MTDTIRNHAAHGSGRDGHARDQMTDSTAKRRNLAVVTAGLSQPSSTRLLADRLAKASTESLTAQGIRAEVQMIELRDIAVDITNNLLTGFPSPALQEALQAVTQADGLIVATPIFSASYSGLFKSFFDVLDPDALADKPVLISATGGSVRHSLALEHALRPMFAYLRATTVPIAVYAASVDWSGASAEQGTLADRIKLAGRQLAQLMAARQPVRQTEPGQIEASPSFQTLLLGQ